MALALFIFVVGYCFEITSLSETATIVATKLQYIGVSYIGLFMLLFILEHCGRSFKRSFIFMLMIILTITLILVQMWPMSTIFYKEIIFVVDAVVPYLHVTGSTFYYIFCFYTYLLTITAVIVALLFCKKSKASVRKQSLTIITGIAITGIGNMINIFKLTQ